MISVEFSYRIDYKKTLMQYLDIFEYATFLGI